MPHIHLMYYMTEGEKLVNFVFTTERGTLPPPPHHGHSHVDTGQMHDKRHGHAVGVGVEVGGNGNRNVCRGGGCKTKEISMKSIG